MGILVVIHEVICKNAHGCSACVKKVMAAVQGDVLLLGGGKKCPTFLFLFFKVNLSKTSSISLLSYRGLYFKFKLQFLAKEKNF